MVLVNTKLLNIGMEMRIFFFRRVKNWAGNLYKTIRLQLNSYYNLHLVNQLISF